MSRSCEYCGGEIPVGLGAWATTRQRRHCSVRCNQMAYRRRNGVRPLAERRQPRVMVVCPTCQRAFPVRPAEKDRRKYCSHACVPGSRVSRHARGVVAEYYPFKTKREWDAARRACIGVVRDALLNGLLVAQPCEVCGNAAEAHHDDYGKPLEVRWLCRPHHRQRHAEMKREGCPPRTSAVVVPRRLRRRYASHLLDSSTVALVRHVTTAMADALREAGLTEMALAERLHVSRQRVNQQFAGGFRTLFVVAAYADALDCDVRVQLVRRGSIEATHAA